MTWQDRGPGGGQGGAQGGAEITLRHAGSCQLVTYELYQILCHSTDGVIHQLLLRFLRTLLRICRRLGG